MMILIRFLVVSLLIISLNEAKKSKKPKKPGCKVGKITYKEGEEIPSDPSRPCEECICKKSKVECKIRGCPAPQEGFCVKEGECCPSPCATKDPCDNKSCGDDCSSRELGPKYCQQDGTCASIKPECSGTTCTSQFEKIPVSAKKGKKTYKFLCDFSMMYNNKAVETTKSSVKCELRGHKAPKGLSAKVNLKGEDGLLFAVIVNNKLGPFAITSATVKGANCEQSDDFCGPKECDLKCNDGETCVEDIHVQCAKAPCCPRWSCTAKNLCDGKPCGAECTPYQTTPLRYCQPNGSCGTNSIPNCTVTDCKECESIEKGQRCGQDGGPFQINCSQCCHTSSPSSQCAEWRCDAGGWLCQEQCTTDPVSGDCLYNNRLYSLGETINIVDKCSVLTCEDGRLGPQWDIEILGCSCCQHNGRLLKDGDKVELYNGQEAKCCDGQMVTPIDIPGGLGESVINLSENGQTIIQQNYFNYSTGLLTLVVPPHIAILQQNFSESTSMFHEATDAKIIKANSSCVISTIPHDTNVYGISKYFEQLKNGTAVWDNNNVEVVYNVKMIKSVVGPEERKTLIPAMNNLCNNEVIKKTDNHRISEEKYEKLVNGEIVFLNDSPHDSRSFCAAETSCTSRWPNACGNTGWQNPETGQYITMHTVSSTSICLTCCLPVTPLCNCTAQFPNLCPCEIITNKAKFEECLLMEDGDGDFSLNFEDSDGNVGTQLTTYNPNSYERSVKIQVPSHGEAEELTILMHSHKNKYWHNYATNNMMMKLGSTCHIRTLPTNIFPFDIALGIKHIDAGNFALVPEVEKKKNLILLNDGLLTSNEILNLNAEINEICNNNEKVKYQEVDVSDEQFQTLNNGGIIDLGTEADIDNDRQMRGCNFLTMATSNDNRWGCWRWPNPDTGTEITVHGVIQAVIQVTCCIEDPSHPFNCCDTSSFCSCEDIVDQDTFAQCMVPAMTVLGIQDSPEVLINQVFAYNRTGSGHLSITVEAHSDLEEATMVLDKSQGVQMLKRNNSCHLLPLNGRDPMKVAIKAAEIEKILDGPLTSAMETVSTSVLVPHPGVIPALPENMAICNGIDIILADEVAIDQAQYHDLEAGQVITLPLGSVPSYGAQGRMDTCTLLTKCVGNNGSSCIRWPNPGTGASIAVHGLVTTPTCLSCCVEGHDPMFCDCDQITDIETFQQCLYPPKVTEIIAVITGAHGSEQYGNLDIFTQDENSPGLQLTNHPDHSGNYPVPTSAGVGIWINKSIIVCQGSGLDDGVDDGCLMVNAESSGSWIKPTNTILTNPLTWGGASAKYKSGPNGDEPGETWWIIGGDPQGTTTQEWNSVLGANPWEPPVLPVVMNTPCMVAISDREIFVTSTPMFEPTDTNLAWIYSRDYPENGGWKTVVSLQKKRLGPACGFLPEVRWGWIVVAGGYKESSTEILYLGSCGCATRNLCPDEEWCTWTSGPDLGDFYPYGPSMVTLSTGQLVLFGDDVNILAINSTFTNWEAVGKMDQPRHSAVALAFSAEATVTVTP